MDTEPEAEPDPDSQKACKNETNIISILYLLSKYVVFKYSI